jgi:ankyrin repeat protein
MNLDEQLIDACERGDSAEVERLVKMGATIEGERCYPMTPLTTASACGYGPIVEYLLEKGARVDAPDKWHGAGGGGHRTPLMFAAACGHIDVAKMLLGKGADVMVTDAGLGAAVVFWAVCSGKVEMLELLVSSGASLLARDRLGQPLLFWALGRGGECRYDGDPSIVEPGGSWTQVFYYLLKIGVDLHSRSSSGETVLFPAVCTRDTELAQYLLGEGCDVNACDDWGLTPLIWAATTDNNLEVTELLLKAGADVNHRTKDGQTALFWAKDQGCEDAVELLLKYGADAQAAEMENKMRGSHAGHPVVETIARLRSRHRL